tara:strand:+ start:111 stop:590 length:480 start_codon:yes stop_codon:yes gene_type:complete
MSVYILFSFILSFILFSIAMEDMGKMKISENKLRLLAGSAISYILILGISDDKIDIIHLIIKNLFAMLFIFILLLSISYISYKILRINSLGFGDIKLSAISSLWLGIELSIISLYISFLLSAIYSIYGKVTKRFKTLQQYPFAPFLSIGIICSWILDKI